MNVNGFSDRGKTKKCILHDARLDIKKNIPPTTKDVSEFEKAHQHKLFEFWCQISPITLFVFISLKKILDNFLETNQNK